MRREALYPAEDSPTREISIMVVHLLPKQGARVRFSYLAPEQQDKVGRE